MEKEKKCALVCVAHKVWFWALLAVAIVAIWLGVAWMEAWFPFRTQGTPALDEAAQAQLERQRVLDSLTAPAAPSEVSQKEQTHVLDSLTPSSEAPTAEASASAHAVLDSLTPPSQPNPQ